MERRKILLFGSINDGVYYCIRFGSKERTEKSCDFLLRLMSRGRVNDIKFFCFLKTVICYLLSVTQKFVFGNCQLSTVTLAIDIGFALMMSEMYVFYPYTMLGK